MKLITKISATITAGILTTLILNPSGISELHDAINPLIITNNYKMNINTSEQSLNQQTKQVIINVDLTLDNETRKNNKVKVKFKRVQEKQNATYSYILDEIILKPSELTNKKEFDNNPEITKTFTIQNNEKISINLEPETNKPYRKYNLFRFTK